MSKQTDFESLYNQEFPDNQQGLISAAKARLVMEFIKSNVIFNDIGGTGYAIQYSYDALNFVDVRSSTNRYYRISADGGETWTGAIFDPNYLRTLILDAVPTEGNNLKKLYDFIQQNTSSISNLTEAFNLSPDDVQNLEDVIALINANPTTFEEALFTKLNTTIWNTFIGTTYPNDLASKAALEHTHAIANITGLSEALASKASSTHTHSKASIQNLGFYTITQVDALIAATNNNLPDIEGSSLFARRRFNVAYFDAGASSDDFKIKIGRTDTNSIYSGSINLSVLINITGEDGLVYPLVLTVSGTISGGVWQNAKASTNRTNNYFTQVQFLHSDNDLFLYIDMVDEHAGYTALVTDVICEASTAAGLINASTFECSLYLEYETLDLTETVFQPLTTADLEPSTF